MENDIQVIKPLCIWDKFCIVPNCKNSTRNAPDKKFLFVPRGADIRRKWCKVLKRDMISPSTSLYCCEDHFNLEEDTENYTAYQIKTLHMNQKATLRLKKGILPHKFDCQKEIIDNIPTHLVKESAPPSNSTSLSCTLIQTEYNEKESNCEAGGSCSSLYKASTSTSSSEALITHTEDMGNKSIYETGGNSSLSYIKYVDKATQITNQTIKHVEKAVQVNTKVHYRSKGLNVNIPTKTKNIAVSPLAQTSKTISTSPLKMSERSGLKRLFQDNSDDIVSVSSAQPLASSSSFEPEMSSGSSWVTEYDSDDETEFKNNMRRCMVTAIEKEPKMLIGLPHQSYYLIKLLSENIPLPTVDILITLKKVKLNESFNILAMQFGTSQSTVSRTFSRSIVLLAQKVKDLIVWPTPEEIFKNLPISFRARYSNVVSIIDCLEIQIEKPSDSVHQSMSWSQYKKCNTLKYLISCTPDGVVNFISDGYGGRTSDVIIVEDCGFLNHLPPKTALMADRGFKDISHLLIKKDCTLIRPPSVFKSVPSTKEEVKQSKRIAALRIHIERVISRLREFHMLLPHACVDHNLIPIIDDVIVVASGLINMQDALIRK